MKIKLDEINYAVKFSLISKENLLGLLDLSSKIYLIFNGTEMKLIKHPYQNGIKAQIGIEF